LAGGGTIATNSPFLIDNLRIYLKRMYLYLVGE